METPKNKPWNFCETPEEKCTMNYCDENGCQSRKRNLVEPKKSKAVTFILDQIDKAIEKSTLEQQIEKLEADKVLYRKVVVTEEKPQSSGFYWIENIVGEMKSSYYDSLLKMFTGDYANFWLKPLPDNEESLLKQNAELREWKESSTQIMADLDLQEIGKVLNLKLGSSISEQTLPAIKKLKSDKAELLEALENSRKVIEWYMENTMPESDNHTDFFNIGMNQRSKIESLIQKMKKCQENTPH